MTSRKRRSPIASLKREAAASIVLKTSDSPVIILMRSEKMPEQIVGSLTEHDAQDAVEIGVLDIDVMAECIRKHGLAVAAGATQRSGYADGVAPAIE